MLPLPEPGRMLPRRIRQGSSWERLQQVATRHPLPHCIQQPRTVRLQHQCTLGRIIRQLAVDPRSQRPDVADSNLLRLDERLRLLLCREELSHPLARDVKPANLEPGLSVHDLRNEIEHLLALPGETQ